MAGRATFGFLCALLAGPVMASPGSAQPAFAGAAPGPDVAQWEREARCLREVSASLRGLSRRFEESVAQAENGRLSEAARRDARLALDALRTRHREIAERARGCVEDTPPPAARPVQAAPPPTPAAAHLATPGDSLVVFEENTLLSPSVLIERAEQVDGTGSVSRASLQNAMRGLSSRLERCYERFLRRGSLTPGRVSVGFTLRRARAVHRIEVFENEFDDAFGRCVARAMRRLRVRETPQGGPVTVSYRLRLPAPDGPATPGSHPE